MDTRYVYSYPTIIVLPVGIKQLTLPYQGEQEFTVLQASLHCQDLLLFYDRIADALPPVDGSAFVDIGGIRGFYMDNNYSALGNDEYVPLENSLSVNVRGTVNQYAILTLRFRRLNEVHYPFPPLTYLDKKSSDHDTTTTKQETIAGAKPNGYILRRGTTVDRG